MKLAQPVGVVVGVALMVAPAVFDYAGTDAGNLHRVAGPLAASFAIIAGWEATFAMRWPNVVLASALLLAPLLVDHSGTAVTVGAISGVVLAAATPFAGPRSHQLGGGWLALVNKDGRDNDRRQRP